MKLLGLLASFAFSCTLITDAIAEEFGYVCSVVEMKANSLSDRYELGEVSAVFTDEAAMVCFTKDDKCIKYQFAKTLRTLNRLYVSKGGNAIQMNILAIELNSSFLIFIHAGDQQIKVTAKGECHSVEKKSIKQFM